MSWEQLREWLQYESLEPWGERWQDLRFGLLAAILINSNRSPKSTKSPAKPTDFFGLDTGFRSSRGRKPLTDPQEFRRATERMKLVAQAKG